MKGVVPLAVGLSALGLVFASYGRMHDSGAEAPGTPPPAPAQTTSSLPARPASEVGELGPLLPFHKDAIAAGLTIDSFGSPKICFWMRPSEYAGTDLVDPNNGPIGTFKPEFNELVYGGFGFSETLDASVKSRIKADIYRENTQCFDMDHPDAFKNSGKFRVEDLTPQDFALNAGAFTDAGKHGGGLNYNAFCSGNVALADGRWLIVGGHDKTGNAGLRKMLIFDPNHESWVDRPEPPVKSEFELDPSGTKFQHVSARDEANTDPPIPSDMKYQRWYPTAVTLPDETVLVLSGSDLDTSVGPEEAGATKVRQAVPEIYDPSSDRTFALENARKLLAMYPRSYVVQTGWGWNDWEVAVVGAVAPPLPTADEIRDNYDPYRYDGKTYLLDVLGAEADPYRDDPAEDHWTLVANAASAHDSGAGAALWTLDEMGMPSSQKIVLFGGSDGRGSQANAIVEMIDFEDPAPTWRQQQPLVRPASQNNAQVLPDGKVVIFGGRAGRGSTAVNTYEVQIFDPATGQVTSVAQTTVPRHDHSTVALDTRGRVVMMGGNRVELVPGNPDAGVPVAQMYKPPYLFRGARPVIDFAPDRIWYGDQFGIDLSGHCDGITSVALIRMGPVTHNWDWGNRYVRLSFEQDGPGHLTVAAPAVPAAAVPGRYLLFVLGADGVPSIGQLVHVGG
jgi:hypothetical protein